MARKIRIECEQRAKTGARLVDLYTGQPAFLNRGEDLVIELGLFQNRQMMTKADVSTITVNFYDAEYNLVLTQYFTNEMMSPALTASQWRQGVGSLARLLIAGYNTATLPAGFFTMEVWAHQDSGDSIFASGLLEGVTQPTLVLSGPVIPGDDEYWTKAQADARYDFKGEGDTAGLSVPAYACLAADSAGGTLDQQAAVRLAIGAAPATVTETVALGPDYSGGGTEIDTEYAVYDLGYQSVGTLEKIILPIETLGSGALKILHIRETAPGTVTVVDTATVTVGGTGDQEIELLTPFELGENDYPGLQFVTGGARPLYTNSTGGGYRVRAGVATGSGLTFDLIAPAQIYYKSVITRVVPFPTLEYREGTTQCELETVTAFTSLPSGWSNQDSAWTFAGGMATAGATGKILRTGKIYGLLRRSFTWLLRIGSTSNIMSFQTNPVEGILAGSMVKINASTNQVILCGAYTGANTPTALSGGTHSLGFTMATGKDYLVTWSKDGKAYTFRVEEMDGPGLFEVTRTANRGYTAYPSFGYDQGTMQGSPGLKWDSGGGTGPTVKAFRHWAPGNRYCKLYKAGDSRAENFGIDDADGSFELLAAMFPPGEVHVSGVGGATVTSADARIRAECFSMRPATVVLDFGTNSDGTIAAFLPPLISFLKGIGSRVVCTIPARNAYEAGIIAAMPVDLIHMDKALTASGVDSTPVAAYYTNVDDFGTPYNDLIHENAVGVLRVLNRYRADVPWLLPY